MEDINIIIENAKNVLIRDGYDIKEIIILDWGETVKLHIVKDGKDFLLPIRQCVG